jgi:hypothetical protein
MILVRLNYDINEYRSNYKRNKEKRKIKIVSTPSGLTMRTALSLIVEFDETLKRGVASATATNEGIDCEIIDKRSFYIMVKSKWSLDLT